METCDHGLEHQADVRPSPPTVRWKQSFSRAIGRAEVENSPRGDGWDGLNHTPLSIALVSAIHAPHRQPDKPRVRQAARQLLANANGWFHGTPSTKARANPDQFALLL